MPTDFNVLKHLYDTNRFVDLLRQPDGLYWLKLRSVSRVKQLRALGARIGIECENVPGKELFAYIYNRRPAERYIDEFIRSLYETERAERRDNENNLISQLYQMKTFDWGGLYQNSLEQAIVNNYVKKIQSWETLNSAIDNELHLSMRGYVRCSWYNHWTSILIEDIFADHPAVLPAIGRVKKVDLFIHNFPFDLKVTHFPNEYMQKLRKESGLKPEFTAVKSFCKQEGIWFDANKPERVLLPELLDKIAEDPTQSAREFIADFRKTRIQFIQQTVENPNNLKVWLYENQGVRRFDAANRFFLILVDLDNLEESWKLKRNKKRLRDDINAYLNTIRPETIAALKLEFEWNGEIYETYADILFIVVHRNSLEV
jgi:hypothetical protein